MCAMFGEAENKKELVPEGKYAATCFGVIDIGTQETDRGPKRKWMVLWEIPELRVKDREGKDMPMIIKRKFNDSMYKGKNMVSGLRGVIEDWLDESLEGENAAYDPKELIGRPCNLRVEHDNWNGTEYAKVAKVSPYTGDKPLKAENPPMYFAFSDPWEELPENMYEWLKKMLMETPEYKAKKDDLPY